MPSPEPAPPSSRGGSEKLRARLSCSVLTGCGPGRAAPERAPKRGGGARMKALFLGNVAADTANGIKDRLPSELRVEILPDPRDLIGRPAAAADADILVTNIGGPTIRRRRASGSC